MTQCSPPHQRSSFAVMGRLLLRSWGRYDVCCLSPSRYFASSSYRAPSDLCLCILGHTPVVVIGIDCPFSLFFILSRISQAHRTFFAFSWLQLSSHSQRLSLHSHRLLSFSSLHWTSRSWTSVSLCWSRVIHLTHLDFVSLFFHIFVLSRVLGSPVHYLAVMIM